MEDREGYIVMLAGYIFTLAFFSLRILCFYMQHWENKSYGRGDTPFRVNASNTWGNM